MKISPLSLLLATTFLSTSAFALTADELGTSSNVDWKEVSAEGDNTVSVETPEGYKIFQYTYTPNGRTVYNEGIENVTGNIDADFVGISGKKPYGNGIYSNHIDGITSISSDFIGNKADYIAHNGFIDNISDIQNIKGDFISNVVYGHYYAKGVGITNNGNIDNIEGDFIGNMSIVDKTLYPSYANIGYDTFGGAIYNSNTITNIAGNFIGNLIYYNTFSSTYGGGYLSSYGGAIANDYGNIETITGDAIGNYIKTNGYGYGGFLYNTASNPNAEPCSIAISLMSDNSFYNIGSINGNIISNHVMAYNGAYGGAISNINYGSIAEINSDSISYNYAIYDDSFAVPSSVQPADYNPFGEYYSGNAYGGAIYNEGTIGQINANISNNYAGAGYAIGGAILNESIIQSINGNISSNYAISSNVSYGGAIYTSSPYSTVYIGDITGDIVGNYAISQEEARGGFLYQIRQRIERIDEYSAQIGNIIGNIEKNYAAGNYYADGGAIYNYWSVIENITGNISNNYVYSSDGYATGGAISNNGGKIGNITGDFTKNYAYGYNEALGGAIYNVDYDWLDTGVGIDNISGSLIGNYAKSEGYAFGGAIFNEGGDLTFTAKGKDYKISGNYTQDRRGKINNAIWMQNSEYFDPLPAPTSINVNLQNDNGNEPFVPSLNFKVTKNGSYTIDDQIDGGYYYGMVGYDNSDYEPVERYGYGYNINISGDACPQCEWNSVRFNNLVNNVNNLTVTKTQMALGKDAVINVVNNYIAKSNPYLRLDLDAVNEKVGQLNIGGQVVGTTSVIVNVLKNKETSKENSIVFATASRTYLSEEEAQKSFEVYRVVGSPYMWAISYNDTNKTWGLYSTSDVNNYTEDCAEKPETPEEPDTPEVFDGFKPTLDRIKSGVQVVDYISDVEALPNSAFAYQEATSGDNSFSFTDTNAYGAETDKSYKIVLKPEEFSTSSDLTFTADDNGSIEVQLPNGETQYFSYEYTGDSDYVGIYYEDSGFANGGAIWDITEFDSNIINADFIENYVSSSDGAAVGGAIYNNDNTIADITGDFVGNYAESGGGAFGGAIMNGWDNENSIIGNITGDFVGNYTNGEQVADSGAIANAGTIGNINGDFIGNYANSDNGNAYSGAIGNYGEIGNITGDFISNYASGYWDADGGAIYNDGTMGDITGDFIGNYAVVSVDWATGGAIVNFGEIGNITGDFISNHVKGDYAYGGAINNDWGYKIGNTTGDFIGNYAEGKYMALGGAIYTNGNTEYVYDDGSSDIYEVGTISGSFIDNYVKVTDESGIALGGAIFVDGGELTFKSDGITNRFSGNYVEDSSSITNNAIWVNTNKYDLEDYGIRGALNFEVRNGGAIVFDDEIDGGYYDWSDKAPTKDGYAYNVNIYGDVCPQCIVNSVIFNSKVKNVYDLTLDTTQMVLGKNAHIEIVNDYIAQNNPYLRLNVDAVNGKTGQLEIGGQVIGTTQVIANIVNYKDVRGEESIVFATAENDTTGDEESFKIFRTVGSPYKWYVDYDESAKTWGLAMGEEANDYEEDCYPKPEPNPEPTPQPLGPIEVEPEVIAMEALPTAAIAQTNGMIYNIMRKVSINRLYCPGCGFYDYNWNGEPFHNVWVDTIYNGLTIEAPVEIDAKVWGIEAGADMQKDLNNKIGIFVSYRQGNYEMDGKGDKYFAKLGSELDIDSYLAGLYYRYDYNNWYAFATLYGGMQNAEIKTDDGVSADTDGLEFGGSAEIGYSHALNKTVYITPSLGVFYSQISYDDASDDYGKTVEYGDLKQVELEAGLKLSKAVYTDNGTASVYVKPSVVQTLVDGDEINITEIGKVDTIEDKTLGRIEIGGSYGFNDNWSAYGWANYTFGSDYEATSLGAGVNYAW